MVQDIEVAHEIWGKDTASLKGNTTRTKPIHVAQDFVKVPKELLWLHKDVFLVANIFFTNKIPFFLTYSHKICFTAVNHLANRKVGSIYKAFEEIYRFYMNQGFRITVLHVDGEFALLQVMIQCMPGGARVSLTSQSKHVLDAERKIWVIKE